MGYGAYEDLRKEYDKYTLNESEVDKDPIVQFDSWFKEALASDIEEPNAMALSTVSSDNIPSSRIVLLKGVLEGGFIFYSNYNSQKGQEIAANPNVSLLFFWDKLHRQVRIDGKINKYSKEKSKEYYDSRPYKSRIGALASEQSRIAENREEIEKRFEIYMVLSHNILCFFL
jgi:pyridoxamine 5'-phosphate oxidase